MLIIQKGSDIKILTEDKSIELEDTEQRELIAYLWRAKPELIREIVCEECPEHI